VSNVAGMIYLVLNKLIMVCVTSLGIGNSPFHVQCDKTGEKGLWRIISSKACLLKEKDQDEGLLLSTGKGFLHNAAP